MKKKNCIDCGNRLVKDDIALSKKMFGREIDKFYCIKCISIVFDCDIEDLKIKIVEFKEQGCTLFL